MSEYIDPAKLSENIYETIILYEIKGGNTKSKLLPVTADTYMKGLKKFKIPCEYVGGKQTKPYFDVELFIQKGTLYEEMMVIIKIEGYIQKVLDLDNSRDIYMIYREARDILHDGKECTKYSYHFTVDNIRISPFILKKRIEDLISKKLIDKIHDNEVFDDSVYSEMGKNQGLFPIYTNGKASPIKTNYEPVKVPMLKPRTAFGLIDGDVDITKYCPSYIEEGFKDYNIKFEEKPKASETKSEPKLSFQKLEHNEADSDGNLDINLINEIIEHLSPKRLTDYKTWLYAYWAIINVLEKKGYSKAKIRAKIHELSSKSDNYKEDEVDNWFDNNIQKSEKRYGMTYLIHTCIKEDAPEFYEQFNKSYYNVKKNFEKRVFKCYDPICFIELNLEQDEINQKPYYIYSEKELITKYKEESYYAKSKKGDIVKHKFLNEWLLDETKKIYNAVVFKPYQLDLKYKDKYFNLFKGFRVSLLPVCKDYEMIKPVLEHIKVVLCKNDENIWNWFSQYIAQMFKHPEKKTNTVIVFKGKQGCGKNIIIDMIADGIIGDEYSVSTANPERVFFGNFNSLLGNKVLAICNEAGNALRDCMDRMKDLATCPYINVEKKGKDPIPFDNYINIMATTNNLNPLDISIDDRRMVWIECDNRFVGDEAYFEPLVKICNSDKGVSALYHYFKEEVKITIENFQISRPITQEYKKLQKLNTPNPIKFLLDYSRDLIYKKYKGEENAVVKRTHLYIAYNQFCTRCKYTAFNRDGFESRIITEDAGIKICTFHGNECIKFNKTIYEAWIDRYKQLDGDVENIVFDDNEENEEMKHYIGNSLYEIQNNS